MDLIDAHCHLTFEELHGQLDGVLERAAAAGVRRMITVGTTPEDSRRCAELASRREGVFASVGIHPHEADRFAGAALDELAELMTHPRVVACGEMGLDYHYDHADRRAQRRLFEELLALSAPTGKPLIIHCRRAVDDTVAILDSAGLRDRPVVFHCFTGSPAEAARIRDHGWRLSFTGIVTFKNASELRAVARDYPADELMLETDSPYLSPEPVRNVRPNEPAHVIHTARFLAELRGVPVEELVERATRNTVAFFGLDQPAADV